MRNPEFTLSPAMAMGDQKGGLLIRLAKTEKKLNALRANPDQAQAHGQELFELMGEFNNLSGQLEDLGIGKEDTETFRELVRTHQEIERLRGPGIARADRIVELCKKSNSLADGLAKHGLNEDKIEKLRQEVILEDCLPAAA
ncbi:MAG: hypothetical protein V1853_02050 [bacterium]